MRNSINCLFARRERQQSAGAPARSNRMYVNIHSGSRQLLHALLYLLHPCSRARSASYPAHKNPAFLRYA